MRINEETIELFAIVPILLVAVLFMLPSLAAMSLVSKIALLMACAVFALTLYYVFGSRKE
jgi:hypothetical protein